MQAPIDERIVPEVPDWEVQLAYASAFRPKPRPVDDRTTPVIGTTRQHLASANIRHLSEIIRQLVELRKEEASDEYGTLRASQHAFDLACHLVTDAAIVSALQGRQIPRGCASTDSEGGIHIEWIRPTVGVSLVVPATDDRDAYLYHEVRNDYATEPAAAEALARWLREIE